VKSPKTSKSISRAGSARPPARVYGGFKNTSGAGTRTAFSKLVHLKFPQLGPPKGQLPPFNGTNLVALTPVDYGRFFANALATGAFSVGAGLATGLSIDVDTGIISGTPTTQVLTTVVLTVLGDHGSTTSVSFDHTIVV